jgi:hypothetical protein
MEKVKYKIKPKWKVILIMIFRGWWKIGKYNISNLFGPGWWSYSKFRECGKTLEGFMDGRMFKTDIWDFQEIFTER